MPTEREPGDAAPRLRRELGVVDAVLMGLGSIVGTGVFVTLGLAVSLTGGWVTLALAVAAGVALCNGLGSAQLAAVHPVSGGAYEYAYRRLHPILGFLAGWMFLCAKSASAATAALGIADYLLAAVAPEYTGLRAAVALAVVALLTLIALFGARMSSQLNAVLVAITVSSLGYFIGFCRMEVLSRSEWEMPFFEQWPPVDDNAMANSLEACALLFVAYTGYGRIATLGEEVREPRQTIPRAIAATLALTFVLYLAVALAGLAAVGPVGFANAGSAPLESIARSVRDPWAGQLLAVGAVTAMTSVLLNLILGLSRVVLAMARRGDMPTSLAAIDAAGRSPQAAVAAIGLLIAALTALGHVKTTWSLSAFTVLVYYAINNLCALRLRDDERLFPRFVPFLGLASCVFLACWVEPMAWRTGLGFAAVGLCWRMAMSWWRRGRST